jgi:hypothetical protein
MGGSGPSRANKFLYVSAHPPPSVWALKPPLWALVHKTTYVPMIYTALCIMFWMRDKMCRGYTDKTCRGYTETKRAGDKQRQNVQGIYMDTTCIYVFYT